VSITVPAQNTNFPNPPVASINLATTATGPEVNGWITKVEFYANNALIGTRTFGPWNFTWNNIAQGNYTLTAIAYDNFNATTTSAPINISVGPKPGQLFFLEVDHLNTPRQVYDQNQTLVWKWDQQEPFGADSPNGDPNSTGNVFELPSGLSGYYRDRETGIFYAMQRDCYDPATGRFCESDPIGLRGGPNSYVYVASSPLAYVDIDGLFCVSENYIKVIAATGGGAVTGAILGRSWRSAVVGAVVGGGLEVIAQKSGLSNGPGGITAIGAVAGFLNGPGDIRTRVLAGIAGAYGGLVQSQSPGEFQNTTAGGFGGLVGGGLTELLSHARPSIINVAKGGAAGVAGGFTQDALEALLKELVGCKNDGACVKH